MSGVTVAWSLAGDGSLDGTTSVTDANGLAEAMLTTSATPETVNVVASVGSATSIMFTETGT